MRKYFKNLAFLVLALFITSCTEIELGSHIGKSMQGPPPQGTFKVGNPYKVEGKWYRPQETYSYTETGIASWYGPGFHGKKTANGERFDTRELTAAHRTLQMPSLVRVTNLENGRSLVVRVNDRGPFARGRVIDVSQRAAELLGFKGRGTAKVRLDLLTDESKQIAMVAKSGRHTAGMEVALNQGKSLQQVAVQTALPQEPVIPGHLKNGEFFPDPVLRQEPVRPTGIYIQAGSFSNPANAEALATRLRPYGMARVYPAMVRGSQFYRVRLGPAKDVPAADALLAQVTRAGQKNAIIIVD